jgi:hypothetical protein
MSCCVELSGLKYCKQIGNLEYISMEFKHVKASCGYNRFLTRLRSCQCRNVDLSAVDFVIGVGRLLFDPVTSYNPQSHQLTGPLLPEYIMNTSK